MPATTEQIKAYAVTKGWITADQDITNLKPSQYTKAAIAVRPGKEKLQDGVRAVTSRIATSMGLRVIPDHVAQRNESICTGCKHFARLRGGEPACTVCNCANKWLKSKWKDANSQCPKGYWDNTKEGEHA